MEILLVIAVGALNAACFLIGAKVGQNVSRDEPVTLPPLNPMKLYQEHREKKEAEREQDRRSKILQNIEIYDGTASGQQDV